MLQKIIRYFKQYGLKKILTRSILELGRIREEGLIGFLKNALRRNSINVGPFADENYRLWIKKNEPDTQSLFRQLKLSKKFRLQPKISIITPIFNPDKKVFIDMLESVISQTYTNWELCMADASSETYVGEIIEEYKNSHHEKIRVKYLQENRGIAGNSNEAISLATGDYIALLDHDDALASFALYEVVKAINENPEVDFIYSDRDIIFYNDQRAHPFFKPEWSPDYLLSQNYLCHINVIRKRLIDEVDGFREGYEGSQDYDLLLRVTERTDRIVHIPKILYHWRVVPGSASVDSTAKPYAYDAAIKALQDALRRRGWKGVVTHGVSRGFYNVKLMVEGKPKVSIIVLAKYKSESVRKCVDSILKKTTYANYEIIIIACQDADNKGLEYYEKSGTNTKVRILKYEGLYNPSEMNNYAVSKSDAKFILFLDDKTEVITGDWLEVMLGFNQRKETGTVGAKLIYPDGTISSAGIVLDEKGNVRRSHQRHPAYSHGYNGQIQNVRNVSAVTRTCMMIRRELFDLVGGFDPLFVEYDDIDFCLKLRERNYLIVYEPHAELYHHESYTRGYEDTPEKVERLNKETELLLKKRGYMLNRADPYFNPNLTAENEDYSIRI